jgi:hypothetical protein
MDLRSSLVIMLSIKGELGLQAAQEIVADLLLLVKDWIVQRESANVSPEPIKTMLTARSTGACHLKDFGGNA